MADVREITRDIKLVTGEGKGQFPHSNSLYIDDDVKGLVDSGLGESLNLLFRDKVDILLNTHFHVDHIKGNHQFSRALIYAHELEAPVIRSEEKFMAVTAFNSFPEGPPGIKQIGYRPSRVDRTFADGETLAFGRTKCQVVHLPGHSAGHCGFFFPEEEILFTGDIDLTSFGPWYGFADCDLDRFIASVQKIIELSPKLIATSHAGLFITGNLREKLQAYIGVIEVRDQLLLDLLVKPHTFLEIAQQKLIYRKHPEPVRFFLHWETGMIKHHLTRLVHSGQIVFEEGKYRKI